MKKLKNIACLIILLTIVSACWEKVDLENLKILNKSDSSIYCSISNSDQIFDYSKYLVLEKIKAGEDIKNIDVTDLYLSGIILANSKLKVPRPMVWEDYVNKGKDKKIRIFLIEKDSVNKYGWEYLYEHNIYNKKYILTLNDLEKLNYEIIYE